MAATHGIQWQIRPWEVIREVVDYLATQGVGSLGANLFIGTMPATPVVGTLAVANGGARISSDLVSRPHLQFLIRDTSLQTAGARAAVVWETLDKSSPPLPSFVVWITADHYPTV